ncbi:MAG: (Fe-S)-binding protein [Oscillospiraceae bacterium]
MALKGLDIFKLSPKKNCEECGCPTCMAFCMKVAQGALPLEKCPYFAPDAVAKLSEATAPPMKTLEVGTGANAHGWAARRSCSATRRPWSPKTSLPSTCAPACPPRRSTRKSLR